MKRLFFIMYFVALLILSACGSESGTDSNGNPIPVVKEFGGRIEKGALQKGATISASEWSPVSGYSGKVFNTETSDNLGGYTIESSDLQGLLDIRADGFFMNENTNTVESTRIIMSGLADSSVEGGNINIITHIIKLRVIELIKNQGKTFAQANNQAVSELYSYFNWTPENPLNTSINQNAKLLFLSAAICKNRTVDQVSALLTTFTADMEDGVVNMSALNSSFSSMDISVVTTNIQTMYGSCPDIASVKAQVLAKLGLVDTTVKIITVQPVVNADFYIFTNGKALYGFKNNTIESIPVQYVQQYLGVTETLNASINDFFSIGSGSAKVLYFSVNLPDSATKVYSQTYAGVLTEIVSMPTKPDVESLFFNDGEFKATYNAGPTNVVSIATMSDMQGGLLYGYYKTDHFISEGVDKGRGAFLVWSTSAVGWLSSNVAGSYVTNIAPVGRMW